LSDEQRSPGTASLVGAGPGDPGLITRRGLASLRAADVVIYDRLVDPAIVAEAGADAELIDVGKARGDLRLTQDEINALIVEKVREGHNVCRLKGGDPFVFGRGGEEALALAAAGLTFEIVPGVTSAVAAAAYAGIPVTHRGVATSFTVVTGSEDPGKPGSQVNWDALAGLHGTLVFLMGWQALPAIARELTARGVPADRPAALVRWGTTPRQQVVTGTLADIAGKGEAAGIGPPVAVIVGDVVSLRSTLGWFDSRPLFGKRVLVTRTRSQASRMRAKLEAHGAWCVEFPAIRVVPVDEPGPLDDALRDISKYDWVTFASSNGARGVRARMDALGIDARSFRGVRFVAVGPATAAVVRDELGVLPDLVPTRYESEAVVEEMAKAGVAGQRVLVVSSDIGRDTLPDGLQELGASVDRVIGYRTKAPEDSAERALAVFDEPGIDITTFTSGSGVDNLVSLLDSAGGAGAGAEIINRTLTACIGPVTAGRAKDRGVRVDIVSPARSMDALIAAIVAHVSGS
jgi:uroporphyrinogen III methyltransferase/synthase